ncbi:MAG: transketolase family protein [Clostridiales bacterium]|nr:transketolase family protein [Clostridiales bacterium]
MSEKHLVRKAFTDALLAAAKEDEAIIALATDSRGSVTLGDFANELPLQFVECGIAEQNAVGIAAGLSNAGLKPFVCSPACFLAARSAEQVKVDVGYCHSNVKLMGVSGGISYGALGTTHHSTQDIAWMRTIPGLQVIIPADANQMTACVKALCQSEEPAYVRMGRGAVEDVYGENPPFHIGKANRLRAGTGLAIIACGEMVAPALKAADALGAAMYDMHTIRPLDVDAVLEAACCGRVLTVEEHCVAGGLGSAVAEVLCQRKPVPMKIMGLPNEPLYNGSSDEVKEHYGLTAEGIIKAAQELMK